MRNFRGIKRADLDFEGHTLLVGSNNIGKSTICEALEFALSPDRLSRSPVVEEFDFYNAMYLDDEGNSVDIRVEVLLTDVTPSITRACRNHLERWNARERRTLSQGEIDQVDGDDMVWCLRLVTVARYNKEEDEFEATTHYAKSYDPDNESESRVPRAVKRNFGFLYLRTLRTGSRALSLERGSLLDIILRMQSAQTGVWENVRRRLEMLDPPIEEGAAELAPVLRTIESRLGEYITMANPGDATRLFVSQLTREHLRKTLSFFISVTADQKPVPFQEVGTGTLNTLVLALLSFIAELKQENVIFAMEEPEIALAPHTQRRIATYLLNNTTQCFVTSHSPYVIEIFDPEQIVILRRDEHAEVTGKQVVLDSNIKAKTYRRYVRRGFAEAMLGRGVVVAEGITEQLVLQAVAERLENSDAANYPLDLSGITIISADGAGSIAEFGTFFRSLDLPTFAFYDKKKLAQRERDALNQAGFEVAHEIGYAGMEDLLAAEVPVPRQWSYLEHVRQAGIAPTIKLPDQRPDEDQVIKYTRQVLKEGKGWGRAAELIEHCGVGDLPPTLVKFLAQLYSRFPRPEQANVASPDEFAEDACAKESTETDDAKPPEANT